ncbi:DUF1295 domain-containing protein [Stakelama sp. CBK3Z-3]|uniref:DUF1295 domain-containing protein n=1 Tax=Stakelama flava TaxID=2860338 RepID=A0ABS6XP86_9SPHN|nr:isoprenylcysteine carboxylmethyltransferase family protein [Stakelama flava]MBW4332033.1 DUF1295 domain-containing protein [Stakelama flava]
MYHDPKLAGEAAADPRPRSAVGGGVGLAGLAGLILWVVIARHYGMDGPFSALMNLVFCGVPMIAWSLVVDRVHRNASTGIDWTSPRRWRDTIDVSLTKLAGLWVTWAGIAGLYATGRFYWLDDQAHYPFAMWCLSSAAPFLFAASIPYILLLDRFLVEPRDGCWALGAWLMGLDERIEREAIFNHLRSWGVKAFFLAFMLAIVPPGFAQFVRTDFTAVRADPVALSQWLITFMFLVDVAFATVGYIVTFRPLDSHIRSANPFAAAWMAALICYPPFVLMGSGGPLDYHPGTADWTHWLAGHPLLSALTGAVLVGLTAIYAWATVAFGFRFSNLTNRGILTHGPYRFTRHPAYLAKNLFWMLSTLPFLTTGSWSDAARACVLMGTVAGVYYWRARTEERHLGLDPEYIAYSRWVERNGLVPRFFAWTTGKPRAIRPTALPPRD